MSETTVSPPVAQAPASPPFPAIEAAPAGDDSAYVQALSRAACDALTEGGALSQADPGFMQRPQQLALAAAVAEAVARRETLVAEAGTGVGKTFAYLVPLLLSGRRALVSTATKSLQDQLYLRDLPRLRDALAVPLRIALLKGTQQLPVPAPPGPGARDGHAARPLCGACAGAHRNLGAVHAHR